MDQIRHTIIKHEALFKEQVQALHKLYGIQKSVMQDIIGIHSQAQILACNPKSFVLADEKYIGSVLVGKHLRPAYASGQAYKDQSLDLTLRPFSVVDYKGCDSLWTDTRGVETLQTAQRKTIRNFDLERLPEEYLNESENQIEPNSSKMSDKNLILLKTATNAIRDASTGADLSVVQVDSPSLRHIFPETNLRMLSLNGQKIIPNGDGVTEGKAFTTDIKKIASFFSPNNSSENKTSLDFPRKCLPAVGKSDKYQDSRHIGKQTLFHEDSLNYMNRKYNAVYSEKHDPENIPEQANGRIIEVEGNFLKSSVISSQGSSTMDSVQCDSTYSKGFFGRSSPPSRTNSVPGKQDLNSFPITSQTSVDHNEVENPNGSANGSNSIQSHYTKSYGDKNGCCKEIHTSPGGEETAQSECEEVAQAFKDGITINPLLAYTLSDSEGELVKEKSAVRGICERIAAGVLLSLAPNRAQVDFQLHGTRLKTEMGKFSKDKMISDKKGRQCRGRHANHCQGGAASESITWARTVNRRRTKRRPR